MLFAMVLAALTTTAAWKSGDDASGREHGQSCSAEFHVDGKML